MQRIVTLMVFLLTTSFIMGQRTIVDPDTKTEIHDTTKRKGLVVEQANSQFFDASGEVEKLFIRGDVILSHDSTVMYCDTGVIAGKDFYANGNIIIIRNDTTQIFADSLLYRSDSMMAYFVGNVVLEEGDRKLFTSFLQYDMEKEWAIYTDTALLQGPNIEVKSKRGVFHLKEDYVNFYEKVTITGDDFDLLSDSLRYYSDLEKAVFLSPTLINQGQSKIYCEEGYYDMKNESSLLIGNAQFVDEERTYTADTIRNDERTKLTELVGNARFTGPDENGNAHKILYNKETESVELIGDAYYKNPENEVKGQRIYYDKTTDDVSVSGRSYLSNPPMIIYADQLNHKKSEGVSFADGNVIWIDTSNNYEIECDHAFFIDTSSYMKAYNDEGKPLLKNELNEADTLFLSGDTLFSFTEVVDQDTFRFFAADNNVELLSEDMQAISDSLVYDGRDSIFRLFSNPVMWSDSSQFSADTIFVNMVDNEVKDVSLIQNAMIISTEDFLFFDQVGGAKIDALFRDDDIYRMYVKGQAKSVYYMKDEGAYIGVNKTVCESMKFIFVDGELTQTRYYNTPTSQIEPMEKANHNGLKLNGFNWRIDQKPKVLEDLYF